MDVFGKPLQYARLLVARHVRWWKRHGKTGGFPSLERYRKKLFFVGSGSERQQTPCCPIMGCQSANCFLRTGTQENTFITTAIEQSLHFWKPPTVYGGKGATDNFPGCGCLRKKSRSMNCARALPPTRALSPS